jgi:predicted nucleic acid-binding protein
MASRVVLDTSAYAHFRARHPVVLQLIAEADVVQLPVTVLGELEAGFRLGRRVEENRSTLGQFLDEPWVSVLTISRDVALQYGRIFANLRRAGTPIPTNDIWIAAAAIDAGSHLVTFDTDFERIEGLHSTVLTAP